ncbi:hypothetical protein P7C73_g6828, partial [Tremellales sp. Uapishka_1]
NPPYPHVRPHSPPLPSTQPYFNPPPLQPAPFPTQGQAYRPSSPTQDARLRSIESSVRHLSSLPTTIANLQNTINNLQRAYDSLAVALVERGRLDVKARSTNVDISEIIWEAYRARAWPLTPWLVGLREPQGLPGLVVNYLGKKTLIERTEASRRECETLQVGVTAEVGRLVADRLDWTREEIRSLGVFAYGNDSTWTNDPSLAALAVGEAKNSGLDKISTTRKSHDDWREWIYLTIMDQLCQVPNFNTPITNDTLAVSWRERLTSSPSNDPATRDRDSKLLAWLEYAETLVEVQGAQKRVKPTALEGELPCQEAVEVKDRTSSPEVALESSAERRRATEPWHNWSAKWEAWAGGWAARSDPWVVVSSC